MENKTLAVALNRKQVSELVQLLSDADIAAQYPNDPLLPLMNELIEYRSFSFIPEGYVLLTNATDCDIQRIRRVRVKKLNTV